MAIDDLLTRSGHRSKGRRNWALTSDAFESHVTTSRYPDEHGETFVAAMTLTLKGRGRSAVHYRLDVDDYFPPGDIHAGERRLHADAVAAIEGLANGEVRANLRSQVLEVLIPRAADWVVVGTTRWEYGARADLVNSDEFTDVRTLDDTFRQEH